MRQSFSQQCRKMIGGKNMVAHLKNALKRMHPTTTQVIMLAFLGAILIGTVLLMIPAATATGERCSFLTALFTATTSVCVTGLVVVDTFSYWSFFGKIIILLLIQIGGLGVITIWACFMLLLRKQLSMESRLIIRDYYNLDNMHGLIRFMRKVVKGTLLAEGAGALLYCFVLIPQNGFWKGLWQAVFTAISAFCNAGIDLFGSDSLLPYQTNLPMNIITMLLIVIGGLGFVVWFDLIQTFRLCRKTKSGFSIFIRRLHEHTRLVIAVTVLLIFTGWITVLVGEYNNSATIGNLRFGEKALVSLFQSVTFRTAGFSTVPQQELTPFTCIAGLFYMFIGGSPAGTAGGVKTVTAALIFLNVGAYIRQQNETVIFGRRITYSMISKAISIVVVSFSMTILLTLLLLLVDDLPPLSAVYEIFSATGTVGLSRGATASLNTGGRIIVILAMYAGRIAPISMALFFSMGKNKKDTIGYPTGKYLIG